MPGIRTNRTPWPREIAVIDATRGVVLAERVRVATSFAARFLGLMGRGTLAPGEGLLIDPCSSIHTFFMRFPIDVLYVGSDHVVRRIDHAMRPWRFGPLNTGAQYVIELPAGTVARVGVAPGDRLTWCPSDRIQSLE